MSKQPFPNLNSNITTQDGMISPVWRAFFQALWDRGGGVIATAFALVNGSAAERFSAAPAIVAANVVTLGQATATFQPIGNYANRAGDAAQTFEVADAIDATGAVSLQQVTATVAPLAPKSSPTFSGWVRLPSYTVAGLPAAATAGAGAQAFVTNALAPAFGAAPVGGGAVGVPVNSDGAVWHVG